MDAVSKNFWVGMMARAFRPGCKNDYMVVLEGPQGVGKSMSLNCIGGKWHTESTESIGSKDFYQNLHGKLIVEIAELDSFSKAEVTRVKQVITNPVDRLRLSYGRTSQDFPRQCVFVGTTNESSYLRDATGARRFWPVKCGQIKIDQINHDRKQLFAEAYKCLQDGATWHNVPYGKATRVQEERYQADEIEVNIKEYAEGKQYIVMAEFALDHCKLSHDRFDKRFQIRVANILHRMGWEPRRETIASGKGQTRVWMPKGSPSLLDQDTFGVGIGFED
jgi:putative DNA primase/helicase